MYTHKYDIIDLYYTNAFCESSIEFFVSVTAEKLFQYSIDQNV